MFCCLCKRIELKQETEMYREQRPPSCESMYLNRLYKPSRFLTVVFGSVTTQTPTSHLFTTTLPRLVVYTMRVYPILAFHVLSLHSRRSHGCIQP